MDRVSAVAAIVDSSVRTQEPSALFVLALALGLAAVHLFGGRLRFLDVVPRSRWLSFAGGASVAYVFVHVLPEVERAAERFERTVTEVTGVALFVEYHVYLLALVGFVTFYGLERLAAGSRDGQGGDREGGPGNREDDAGVFWVHVGSFAVYNALIGYLLVHREDPGVTGLFLFFTAMALHFFVNDYGLRDHHGGVYHRWGRWMLAAAVVGGTLIGFLVEVNELLVDALFSFLAGSVILNVIKEELPEGRQSRFWAFALGAALYTGVLVLL
ncbi:hypothetical protein [Halegenticoccus tardaugens]|uniref:hypothetical protein n=1 Tax=Halegenticoccus tardaugens TaxID=2071624 RepID=UPI001E2B327E|nr:hypothetical protein [Halegenticoccus tardaugens]